MLLMRVAAFIVLLAAFIGCTKARAGTEVHSFDCHAKTPGGETHYEFDLLHYKRGLFLGICPTTKQLQWDYWFDLIGEGPAFSFHQMRVRSEFASAGQPDKVFLSVVAGNIVIDRNAHKLKIDIQLERAGVTNQFAGNGTYSFRE